MSEICADCGAAFHNVRANRAEARALDAEAAYSRLKVAFRVNMMRDGASDDEIERILSWCDSAASVNGTVD